MNNLIETVGKAMQPVRKVKTVEDVIAPYQRVITDLCDVKAEREELITKARVKRELLLNQINALDHAIGLHEQEIRDANDAIERFSDLLV